MYTLSINQTIFSWKLSSTIVRHLQVDLSVWPGCSEAGPNYDRNENMARESPTAQWHILSHGDSSFALFTGRGTVAIHSEQGSRLRCRSMAGDDEKHA